MTNRVDLDVRKVPDARVRRSTRGLAQAMSELLAEQEFASITVQQLLDRAGVGRATFYKHFRNKDDVLLSSYESMFAWLETRLDAPSPAGRRLVPVTEFVEHVDQSRAVLESLRASDRLDEIWELGVGFTADMIGRRLVPIASPGDAQPLTLPRSLAARMLAGALVEMLKWWLEHPERASAVALDRQFHAMARTALPAFGFRV